MDRTSGGGESRNISRWFFIWSQSLAGGGPPTQNHRNHQHRHISIVITTTTNITNGPPSPSTPPTSVFLKAPVCLATKDHAHFAAFTDQRQIKASPGSPTSNIKEIYIRIYLGHHHHNNFSNLSNLLQMLKEG